jgi:hypothetical protein
MFDFFESSELPPAASTHLVGLVAVAMIAVSSMISPRGLATDISSELASDARSASRASEAASFDEGEYVIFIGDRAYRAYLIPESDIAPSAFSGADARIAPLRF